MGDREAVVKETVDKRKKPETVTTHNNETTATKKFQKGGARVENGQRDGRPCWEPAECLPWSAGGCVVVPWTLTNFPASTRRLGAQKPHSEGCLSEEVSGWYFTVAIFVSFLTGTLSQGIWGSRQQVVKKELTPLLNFPEPMFNIIPSLHQLSKNACWT